MPCITEIYVTAKSILDDMMSSDDMHAFICHTAMKVARKQTENWYEIEWENCDVGFQLLEMMCERLGVSIAYENGRMSHGVHTFIDNDEILRYYTLGIDYMDSLDQSSLGNIRSAAGENRRHAMIRVGILTELLRVNPDATFIVYNCKI